ncbi:MAG: hypothetical protein ACKOS8_18280, partial [Gemmataceae bacterium]
HISWRCCGSLEKRGDKRVGVERLQVVHALAQAQEFQKVIRSTGLIVTKLDGTAKGGSVFAIKQKLQLPVKLIGVGEGMDDLEAFDPDAFVAALFE